MKHGIYTDPAGTVNAIPRPLQHTADGGPLQVMQALLANPAALAPAPESYLGYEFTVERLPGGKWAARITDANGYAWPCEVRFYLRINAVADARRAIERKLEDEAQRPLSAEDRAENERASRAHQAAVIASAGANACET